MVNSSTSISVFWNPPPFSDQNGVITGYEVNFANVNRSNIVSKEMINGNITTVTFTNLKEFEVYSITIAASTSVGRGPFSVPVSNETLKDGSF